MAQERPALAKGAATPRAMDLLPLGPALTSFPTPRAAGPPHPARRLDSARRARVDLWPEATLEKGTNGRDKRLVGLLAARAPRAVHGGSPVPGQGAQHLAGRAPAPADLKPGPGTPVPPSRAQPDGASKAPSPWCNRPGPGRGAGDGPPPAGEVEQQHPPPLTLPPPLDGQVPAGDGDADGDQDGRKGGAAGPRASRTRTRGGRRGSAGAWRSSGSCELHPEPHPIHLQRVQQPR